MTKPHALYGSLFLAVALAASGCSGTTTEDAGTPDRDGGPRDSGAPEDAGVRTFCTIPENNPICMTAEDCEDWRDPQSACLSCPKDNSALCVAGHCRRPAPIPASNNHVYRVAITGFENEVITLVGIVVAAETAGGESVTCEKVMNEVSWADWQNTCYNVLRTRYFRITDVAQVYPLNFSAFASGQRVIFAAYGFTDEDAALDPVGVTCTEYEVQEPGTAPVDIMGDTLVRIQ